MNEATEASITEDAYPLHRSNDIVLICDTPKGRGVFAAQPIAAGTIIETCPVLVLDPQENQEHIRKTSLYHYTYNWPLSAASNGKMTQTQAVVFGLGSLFNHSSRRQNVGWTRDLIRQVVVYRALLDISQGEELCISYGDRLTFVDADGEASSSDEEDENALLGIEA